MFIKTKTEKIVYPMMGNTAKLNRLGGAFRAWTIARWLDREGSGGVDRELLENVLENLGAHPKTIERWINRAKQADVLSEWSPGYLRYKSTGKAAAIFGASEIGRGVVVRSWNFLFEEDWFKTVWALGFSWVKDNPRSRAYLEEATGVDRQTQWRYGKDNPHMETRPGYTAVKNISNLGFKEKIELAQSLRNSGEGRKGYQVSGDKLIKQIPNVYVCTSDLVLEVKKAERRAKSELSSCLPKRMQAQEDKPERLYFKSKRKAEKSVLRALEKVTGELFEPIERFWFEKAQGGCNWYGMVCNV